MVLFVTDGGRSQARLCIILAIVSYNVKMLMCVESSVAIASVNLRCTVAQLCYQCIDYLCTAVQCNVLHLKFTSLQCCNVLVVAAETEI